MPENVNNSVLDEIRFSEQLFWFYVFKRRYRQYVISKKKKLKEFGEVSAEWFTSLHEEYNEIKHLSELVLSDISKAEKELAKQEFETVLAVIQSYLNQVYEEEEADLLNDCWTPLHPVIPTIQNAIRDAVAPGGTDVEIKENKLKVPEIALMHVYLALAGGQSITEQNKGKISKKYGYSSTGDHLRNCFTFFQDADKRLDLNTGNKKSANSTLNRYEMILPLLQKENQKAYELAEEERRLLQKKFDTYCE